MDAKQSGHPYNAARIIERQMLLHDTLDKASQIRPAPDPSLNYRFITISRDRGSLGDTIAQDLGQRIGWPVYDKELVEYIANNSHVRQHFVQQLDERAQDLVHETVQRLLRMAEGGSFGVTEYRESLLKTLTCLATRGSVILVGRGANFVLRSEKGGLHIRIVGSQEVRSSRLSLRWNLTSEEALGRMLENDVERRNFIRHYFKRNIDDPTAYDLVFNTDHVPPSRVVESIISLMTLPGARSPDRSIMPEAGATTAAGLQTKGPGP